ncbi:DNA (cytosine-5-)-methyltransferase [Bacteroides fragilis CL07T00C01]|uniref:Cytosine-specific methyltransferase n=1 Tax=Bacteroides fragilis CL07T12C05 TaxID=997883 RepID=A0A0E2B0J4_BACFG|nr:DNA cytosine methyltransferase [Bacteroides fragilis]EIK40218.1 DNA (cytosine-5-)-methyltransferase [Bacteroides fragilis CL07T00C01]EIY96081.1 DNA (cytosine-5-)-methyltransferase [Bacteroides fragilis CL07T12C05]MCE9143143.1 DNA cytosine methyltransferase [Bacteroides fragilis]MCI7229344.1 DNA cytosine methyltransferase [Bacteroides fragilis]
MGGLEPKKYIDLFAGCGGLSLGLHLSGWKGVFAIEKSPFAFETLKYNLIENRKHFDWPSWLSISNHDINEVLDKYQEELKGLQGTIDLVAGGPPCQGFSMAGKRVENDTRNQLVFSYIQFIKLVKPKMILFENVKGFTFAFNKKTNKDAIPYSEVVINELKELGYNVKPHIIDFSKYGVPQRRKRFILVGIMGGNAENFEALLEELKTDYLNNKGIESFVSLQDSISDLFQQNGEVPTPDRKGFNSGIYGDINSNYQRMMRIGIDSKNIPDSHSFAHHNSFTQKVFANLIACYPTKGKRITNKEREQWNIKKRGLTLLNGDDVSPTLTSHPDDYIHYAEPRILTVREYARIQSFPDWYQFKMKYTTGGDMRKREVPRYTQIGNAIPPLFAELAGRVLIEILKDGTDAI